MFPTFSTWLLNQELKEGTVSFADALAFISGPVGARSLEIVRTTYPDWSITGQRELKRLLYQNGLFLTAISAQNHFNCETREELRREVQFTKDFVDIAVFVGAQILNVLLAGWGDANQARGMRDDMIAAMKEVVRYAEERAVMLTVEAHGPITDYADEFLAFLADCPAKNLRVCLDTGNIKDGPEGCLRLLPAVGYVHAKYRYRNAEGEFGDAELPRVLARLQASGFRGPVMLEDGRGAPYAKLPDQYAEFCQLIAALEPDAVSLSGK